MSVIAPSRTIAKIIARGQNAQDHEFLFLICCMALRNEKAVVIAPSGVSMNAGMKASRSGPLQPCWRQ